MILALALLLACLAGCGGEAAAEECTYTVRAVDSKGQGLAGVIVNFCTDTACVPVTTDETGSAVFTGPGSEYHVQVVKTPAGWQAEGDTEWLTEARDQSFLLRFAEAEG
jgi:hypothetical protein